MPQRSANYDFIIETLEQRVAPDAAVLDFGCGRGRLVAISRRRGLSMVGIDTFAGAWAACANEVLDEAKAHVLRADGCIPYPDNHFDAVVANQVFEHVEAWRITACLADIARVLKPGGMFLVLFPSRDIWFEGHLRLYFAHWLSRWPALQRLYLRACSRLRLGRMSGVDPASEAMRWQSYLRRCVFYHDAAAVTRQMQAVFGDTPMSLEAAALRFRLNRSAQLSPLARCRFLDPVFRAVHVKRAGRVWLVRKGQAAESEAAAPL